MTKTAQQIKYEVAGVMKQTPLGFFINGLQQFKEISARLGGIYQHSLKQETAGSTQKQQTLLIFRLFLLNGEFCIHDFYDKIVMKTKAVQREFGHQQNMNHYFHGVSFSHLVIAINIDGTTGTLQQMDSPSVVSKTKTTKWWFFYGKKCQHRE